MGNRVGMDMNLEDSSNLCHRNKMNGIYKSQ